MVAVIVKLDEERDERASLAALTALVADDLNHVNALILERMQSPVALIPQLAGHLIAGGGKRMRPMLTLAARAALRLSRRRAITSSPPRSSSSTPRRCCTTTSSTRATCAAAATPPTSSGATSRRAGRRFPVQPRVRADGRGRHPAGARDPVARLRGDRRGRGRQLTASAIETSEEDYLEIIDAKTAALFAAACRIAAVVAERPAAEEEALERLWPQPRHRLPAGRRRDRLFGARRPSWARPSATISATAR